MPAGDSFFMVYRHRDKSGSRAKIQVQKSGAKPSSNRGLAWIFNIPSCWLSHAGPAKVKSRFVLKTKRSGSGSNHFGEKAGGYQRKEDTKACNHGCLQAVAVPSQITLKSHRKPFTVKPATGWRIANWTRLDESKAPNQKAQCVALRLVSKISRLIIFRADCSKHS
jgi:hypothetical protein